MADVRVRTALLSVSEKTEILTIVASLAEHKVQMLSTGGTYKVISQSGYSVTEVAEHTGHREIMDGRVKTLHPKIHGGLLGRRGVDAEVMSAHGITAIDLLVVNLYPFEEVVREDPDDLLNIIENIDIGGPLC